MERYVPVVGKTVVTKQFVTKPILICAPPAGSDVNGDEATCKEIFQPTLPHGERLMTPTA